MLKIRDVEILKGENEYEQQAIDFCNKNNVDIIITYKDTVRSELKGWGNSLVNRYNCYISRNGKFMRVTFTDSIKNREDKKDMTIYSLLACLQKYDVGSYEDFCLEFGYSTNRFDDNFASRQLYNEVVNEYKGVDRVFGDIIDELCEIQ